MRNIIDAIEKNQSFVISSHRSPDGDSIGSCIALGLALEKINKKITYVMERAQEKFTFLDEIAEFKEYDNSLDEYDVGLFLDCSNLEHLHNHALLSHCKTRVNLDHHITNVKYGDLNYIDSSASATAEIVYELIVKMEIPLDNRIAAALYTAIVTDTGNFKYSNVTARTHKIVSKLYEYSNNYALINKRLFDEHSFETIKVLGKALNNLYLMNENKVSIIYLNAEDINNISENTDLEGIINYARDIIGVEVAMFIKETSNNIFRVSFRSNTDYDVSKLAAYYGGGGHSKAAGCTIEGINSPNMINDLVKKIAKDSK